MRPPPRAVVAVGAALVLLPAAAAASGFSLRQHGGRGTAQAGALLARADEPSAVRYDPAALVSLSGLRLQAGLDFDISDARWSSTGVAGRDSEHEIQFTPHIYLGGRPSDTSRWAWGIGVDSPFWSLTEWPATTAADRSSQKDKVALLELRPSVAYAIDERWSVGAALRFVRGDREERVLSTFPAPDGGGTLPLFAEATSTIDGEGWVLAGRFAERRWGGAAVFSSEVELEGDGELAFRPDGFDPAAVPGFDALYAPRDARQRFLLPASLAVGAWKAFGERTRIELDIERERWSSLERTDVVIRGDGPSPIFARNRDWRDVTAVRLGGEHRFASGWRVAAGLAHEPSPVPDASRDFAFPRGDASVLAIGGGYDLGTIAFDFAWSFHDHERAEAPSIGDSPSSTFAADAQALSVSARWRLGERAGGDR